MTSFSHIFRSTRDLAISQGRRPVVCLLGPDTWPLFKEYCTEIWPNSGAEYTILNGIQIRKMEHAGLAFLTVPAPDSGFDVPDIG